MLGVTIRDGPPACQGGSWPSLPKAALATCVCPLVHHMHHLWLWLQGFIHAPVFLFLSVVSLFLLLPRLKPMGSYLTLSHLTLASL